MTNCLPIRSFILSYGNGDHRWRWAGHGAALARVFAKEGYAVGLLIPSYGIERSGACQHSRQRRWALVVPTDVTNRQSVDAAVEGIHVVHIIGDGQINTPSLRAREPNRVADTVIHPPHAIEAAVITCLKQPKTAWSQEIGLWPVLEKF